jgi:hypothetical protein
MTSAAPRLCSSAREVSHGPQTRLRCRIRPVSRRSGLRPTVEPDGAMDVINAVLWSARGIFVCVVDRRGGRISAAEQSDGQAVRSHRRRAGNNGACRVLCRAYPILRRSDRWCWHRRQGAKFLRQSAIQRRPLACLRCPKRRAARAEHTGAIRKATEDSSRMRGVVFSDLIASLGAHRGTLHDVIEVPRFIFRCVRSQR